MLAITTVFLAAVFIGAEFYRFRRRISGLVREIRPLEGDATGLMGAQLQVRTAGAREVTAYISGCQMCVSRVEIGQTVSLVPGPRGYVLRTPWISGRRPGACPREVRP